jgi:hypothetical protein
MAVKGFPRRESWLERRLRRERPVLPASRVAELMRHIDAPRTHPRGAYRLGLAAVVSAAVLVAVAGFGGLGYAATSVKEVVRTAVQVAVPGKADQPQQSSAEAQYGAKVAVCHLTANGQQHTVAILQSTVAAYLRTHPHDYLGSCGAFRPAGAKRNVCVRLGPGRFVAIWVPPGKVPAFLARNYLAHRTRTGTC